MSVGDIATVVGTVFAGVSALIAAAAIYFPWEQKRDQHLMEEAAKALERAYECLDSSKTPVGIPMSDRLTWLTCARHIVKYGTLKKQIKVDVYKTLCEEHEEYWRHRFYLLLESIPRDNDQYYEDLSLASAVVIHAFAAWPKEKADPLDEVDLEPLVARISKIRYRGLARYFERHKRIP